MSYPSVAAIFEERDIDLDAANEVQIENALLEAFNRDLANGMSYLRRAAASVTKTGRRFVEANDPNSPVGKQLIRLLGADIARGVLERHFGIAFGLYNCCGVVAAPVREDLAMTAREQVMFQNGVLASADC